MLRFEDPTFLWLLWLIPVLILVRLVGWRRRKAKLKKLGDPELLKQLMPDISKYRPTVKFVLMLAALALVIVMVARPQMGSKISHDKRNGIETMICLDISNSMLAEDVAPSRLDKSKMLIENLVDNFSNDKIGLIVFAGDAFVQLPITSDYVSAKMFLHGRKITRYLQPVFCKQIMHTIQAPLIFNERNVVIIFFQDILSNVPCINRFNAGFLSKFNGTIDQIVSHLIWYLHHPVILFIRVVLNNFCQLSG